MDKTCLESHDKECSCQCPTPSVQQTLDELDFTRGIWTAAVDGSVEDVLDCLNRKHVHVDTTDSSGYTALHYASRNGHLEICKLLVSHNATVNMQTRSGGVTPLHRAAYCGHTAIVELLLQHNADPCIHDSDGKLPLHKAAEKEHMDIVNALLDRNSNSKTYKDKRGRLPIHCVTNKHSQLIPLLQIEEEPS